jgi:alpha-1,6-mannosyltransferase
MDWLLAAGWATVAMLLAVTWLMPWYVVWLLPFAALAGSRRLQWAAVALTLFVVLVRLIPLG